MSNYQPNLESQFRLCLSTTCQTGNFIFSIRTGGGHDEFEFDNGAILVNKRRVWNAVYMAKLINDQYELLNKFFPAGRKDRDGNPCLIIDTEVNKSKSTNKCINRPINPNEIDNHAYSFDESIGAEYLPNGRMLMSETNNLMSGFVASLFHYRRQIYGN